MKREDFEKYEKNAEKIITRGLYRTGILLGGDVCCFGQDAFQPTFSGDIKAEILPPNKRKKVLKRMYSFEIGFDDVPCRKYSFNTWLQLLVDQKVIVRDSNCNIINSKLIAKLTSRLHSA